MSGSSPNPVYVRERQRKTSELTRQPAGLPDLALGVKVLPGPSLLLSVSVSVDRSCGLSGLCLPCYEAEVPSGLKGDKDVSHQKPFNLCDSVTSRGGYVSECVLSCRGKASTPVVSPFIMLTLANEGSLLAFEHRQV